MPESPLHAPLLAWYAVAARDLPWRRPDAGPWAVLVSEVMLQQTPVARVLPVYDAWLRRWPTAPSLAAERAGEAVRMWGRLGYPGRALRLHAAAQVLTTRHRGLVPTSEAELRALPGVGDYTAAAIRAFAFRARAVVLDTNVRRVLARVDTGEPAAGRSVTVAERATAERLLPDGADAAALWSVATMELGALVCTAVSPQCQRCPVADQCRWRARGYPAATRPTTARPQRYAGTDRQCRGALLAVLQDATSPVSPAALGAVWAPAPQRERALASLIDDGLVVEGAEGSLSLP